MRKLAIADLTLLAFILIFSALSMARNPFSQSKNRELFLYSENSNDFCGKSIIYSFPVNNYASLLKIYLAKDFGVFTKHICVYANNDQKSTCYLFYALGLYDNITSIAKVPEIYNTFSRLYYVISQIQANPIFYEGNCKLYVLNPKSYDDVKEIEKAITG